MHLPSRIATSLRWPWRSTKRTGDSRQARTWARLGAGQLVAVAVALSACGGSRKSADSGEAQPTGSTTGQAAAEQLPSAPRLRPDNVGVPFPPARICEQDSEGKLLNPIEPGRYKGILRTARCDQQKFLIMARVADALGVECNHCHVPHPTDPKTFLYQEETETKAAARWMEATFIRGLLRKDNKVMRCANCHKSGGDKAQPKFLGEPRDKERAQIWMHEVMTPQFVQRSGKRLRCRTCHVGSAPGLPGWNPDVIGAVSHGPQGLVRK